MAVCIRDCVPQRDKYQLECCELNRLGRLDNYSKNARNMSFKKYIN